VISSQFLVSVSPNKNDEFIKWILKIQNRLLITDYYRFQEKDYLAVVRGAPSRAGLRQQLAREGAP
jgi:hypothetical protein